MFKIVSSSAGSGKTYTLTKEYLKLALKAEKPYYFKKILAITFTKAATREMKERIMAKLKAFAEGEEDSMLNDIILELYPDASRDLNGIYLLRKQEIRNRAQAIFTTILHDYSDFSVMTIDSFVQRIVSAFTEELGLPFSFEVEMEASELLQLSVERMLEKVGEEESKHITNILEEYFLEENEEGRSFHNLPEALASFGMNITQEQSYSAIQKNEKLGSEEYRKIRSQLKSYNKRFEKYIAEFGKVGLDIIEKEGLVENDFAYSTVPKYFKKVLANEKIGDELGSREIDAFENDKGWYTKSARPYLIDSIEKIKPELVLVFEKIESTKKKYLPTYLLYNQLIPHLYHLSLLNEIKLEFDKQLRENNRVHISEFNHKILEIVTREPVPFIYERLGEKFNHILIDEFQDTSKLQFANLLPLIDNSLGYDHFNLAVGDSKQAIYRFRGGDMDQIISLYTQNLAPLAKSLVDNDLTAERLENISWHLQKDNLTTNRRSAKEIIEFNNNFFAQTTQIYTESHSLPSLVFDADFQQLVPENAKTGGIVEIEFIEGKTSENEENDAPLMVQKTLEIIERVIADGYNQQEISVLCRQKNHAKQIANALKEANFGVISEDSLSLSFSSAINLITTFIKVLVKPDNKLAKYEALYLFYRLILKQTPDNQDNIKFKAAAEALDVRVFYEFINQKLINSEEDSPKLEPFKLLQLGVFELVEKLSIIFGLFEIIPERDYLFRFYDLVIEFGNRKGSHLSDFLEYWETQKNKISISAPSDPMAITVQTIHKSKGLEYPVVILPYADWQFTPKAFRDKLWVNLERTNELSTEIAFTNDEGQVTKTETSWLKSGSVSLKSDLAKTPDYVSLQYKEECERMLVENMNLLYVALTRPTQRLYILANQEDFTKKNAQEKISYWLHEYQQSIVNNPQLIVDSPQRNTQHSPSFINQKSEIKNQNAFTPPSGVGGLYISTIISSDRSRDMRLRRQANRLFDVDTFEQKKDHGNKVHYALSLIKTSADINTAMTAMQIEGLIDETEKKNIKTSIEKLIENPSLKNLFEGNNEILNEREILTPNGNMHRPDRVVKTPSEVIIVDYKTGIQSESHQKQLKKYINLYKDMGYEHVSGKLIYIKENNVFDIVEV